MNTETTLDGRSGSVCADVVDLKHDIPQTLTEWAINTLGIDSPVQLTQNQFNGGLRYIYNIYIKPLQLLKINGTNGGYIYNHDSIKILCDLVEIYIDLCMVYDKHICLTGFSFLSGVQYDTMVLWENDRKASKEQIDFIKKLRRLDEETLADFLTTGRRNPVGVLAVLNNRHGWSSQRVTHETEQPRLDNTEIRGLLGVKSG